MKKTKEITEQELREKRRAGCLRALARLEQKEKNRWKSNLLLKVMALNPEHAQLVNRLVDTCLQVEGSASR